jgi:hypothetical protein
MSLLLSGAIKTDWLATRTGQTASLVVDVFGEVARVGRIEPDPKQYEPDVEVLDFLLGAPQPTQRSMDPQAQMRGEAHTYRPLFVFKSAKADCV